MVSPQLPYLVIYHFNILSFCTLSSVIISYFFPDGFLNAGSVKMLANNYLCSNHSLMKEICMVPMQYITLWIVYGITILSLHVIRLRSILIPPQKKTGFVPSIFIFSHQAGVFPLILLDWF